MSLVEINWDPADRQLKQFGWVSLVVLPLLAWLWAGTAVAIVIWGGIGAGLAAVGMRAPRVLKPVFIGLSLIFLPIGLIVGELVMLLVFVVAFVPMGLLFRVLGRDRLQLKLDRKAETYWQDKHTPSDPRRYFRQY